MCQFDTLYYDRKNGFVVQCPVCNTIQVGFGNVLLSLSEEEFREFRKSLHDLSLGIPEDRDENTRFLLIPMPCQQLNLLVSPRELRQWEEMLDASDTELQSLKLIRLFEVS